MKKRRILSVLLCLALVAFSLSGCNKTSSKKSTSSKKADSGTLQGMIKSVDVDKKQITIATMPSGNQPPSKPDGDGANNNDNEMCIRDRPYIYQKMNIGCLCRIHIRG